LENDLESGAARRRDESTSRAKGDEAKERDFGILSADAKNVENLFDRVGVDPFVGVPEEDRVRLNELVEQRGRIVHTGKAPPKFKKSNAVDWRSFVEELALKVDVAVASGAKEVTGRIPWT
jgi:hypothetical protein